jgi:hypothetical protein
MIWIERIVLALVLACLTLYGGDWAAYKLRGSPHSKVTVNRFLAVPLKGDKQEFDFLGREDTPCTLTLFPQAASYGDLSLIDRLNSLFDAHAGLSPCWLLRRNPNQWVNL